MTLGIGATRDEAVGYYASLRRDGRDIWCDVGNNDRPHVSRLVLGGRQNISPLVLVHHWRKWNAYDALARELGVCPRQATPKI